MPLFHSNAAVAGFTNIVAAGAVAVLRRRFSASGWLADVRKYGVTFFNYVGKPLTYILATPEQPDDADNPLNFAFGNEAAPLDIDRFAQRFGCIVVDGYGSTEGGVEHEQVDRHAAGRARQAGRRERRRAHPRSRDERGVPARAKFDETGRFVNAEEAIGEMVNVKGSGGFEGYYNNDEANAERMRGGMYWTGDLGYRDDDGFFYFAGRNSDWLRVDGENFAAAPVENVLARHPSVVLVRGVRGAGGRRRRRRDGRAPSARRARRSTRTSSSRSSTSRPISRRSGCRATYGSASGLPSTATQKVLEARAAARALGDRRRRCGGDPGASGEFRPLTADGRGRAARAVRGAGPRPLARTSVSAARAASLCSLRHGDGDLAELLRAQAASR